VNRGRRCFSSTSPRIMQMRTPASVLFADLSDPLRNEDLTKRAAIHQPLGEINPDSGALTRSLTSVTALTGPLCTPMRTGKPG